jgi:hypothetical protein
MGESVNFGRLLCISQSETPVRLEQVDALPRQARDKRKLHSTKGAFYPGVAQRDRDRRGVSTVRRKESAVSFLRCYFGPD